MEATSLRHPQALIVVAHYNEDLSWLAPFDSERVVIYSKGGLADACYGRVVPLPNVGRESHTYLTHLLENYGEVGSAAGGAGHVFFTQGNPFEHLSNPCDLFRYTHPEPHQSYVGFGHLDTEGHYGMNAMRVAGWRDAATEPCRWPFDEWFLRFVDPEHNPRERELRWQGGGLMTLRADLLYLRPRSYLEALCREVGGCSNPETGHYMERSWYYVFNLHGLTPPLQ
jgi:hypothetical protein